MNDLELTMMRRVGELKKENARLKAEIERLTEAWVDKKMQEDRDALLQQVERLTKAGDAMAEILKNQMDNEPDSVGYLQEQLFNRWNAAKEVQS
jgi:uncharacterized small protein (DUF1192 family)